MPNQLQLLGAVGEGLFGRHETAPTDVQSRFTREGPFAQIRRTRDAVAKQGKVVGLDLVEVAPDYDFTNSTSTLAAQLLMNTIGRILHYKR